MFRNYSIDPTKLTEETAKYLEILLKSRVQRNSTLNAGNYNIKLGGLYGTIKVNLTHTLKYHLKIHPVTNAEIDTFRVLVDLDKTPTSRGSFGVVTVMEGVLIRHAPEKFSFDDHKKQIIKEQPHVEISTDKPIDVAKNEATLSRLTPHLHASLPDESSDGKFSSFAMKQFMGKDLAKIIINREMLKAIPTDQRLDISIKILFALQYQIHQFDIIHRDIKPSNVMVNLSDDDVNIIDMGLSCLTPKDLGGNDVDKAAPVIFIGTPGYMAPEVLLKEKHDQLSDIYSIGLLLLEFWGLTDRQDSYIDLRTRQVIKDDDALKFVVKCVESGSEPALHQFNDLLRGDLSDEHAKLIFHIFSQLIAFQPGERISLAEAINQLEEIRIERALVAVPQLNKRYMANAKESAIRIREKMASLSAAKFIEHHEIVTNLFKTEFTGFQEYSKAFDFFKRVLGVSCLSQIKTGDELFDFVERQSKIFNHHLKQCELFVERIETVFTMRQHPQLRESLRDIELPSLASLSVRLNHLILKHKKRKYEFANIIDFNERTNLLLAEINASFYSLVKHKLTDNVDRVLSQFNAVRQIASLCATEGEAGQPLLRLKNELRSALRLYVHDSLTLSSLVAGDRSASTSRMNDVQRLLSIIAKTDDAQKMRELISGYLAQIETGLLFRSNLRSKVQEVLDRNDLGRVETAKNRWFQYQ